ncbi:MFS transporter [Liquorilactobacillus hordei]|uniref:MFS transporter n=1 Tax=Liquorilactobacillus hordei TaxID=468911 RepID=UPI001CBCA793|nr:MFS transporter [Liquorilactobacillus hordei]MBZ2404984.1 MFS transporter [Liquorilactobacillus hordei]
MSELNIKHRGLLKFGILSISTMLQDASAISVAVVGMVGAFSNHSAASVQALVTIPSFSMMIFILLNSVVVKFIGKRNTVIISLLLALIGGVGPAFTSNFTAIQILRFIYGAGTGLYTPLAVSLLGDFFSGDELRSLLGIQAAVSAIGSSAMTFVAGMLVGIDWQSCFWVYFLVIPVLIIFTIAYPKNSDGKNVKKNEVVKNNLESSIEKKSKKLPAIVIIGILLLFVYFSVIMALYTDSGLAIKQLDLSNQGFLGTALSIAGLVSAAFSVLYGKIFKIFKHFTPVVILVISALGFIGMTRVPNMFMFTVYAIMISVSALLVPYVYSTVLENAPASSKNLTISLAMVLNNLGAYISPYFLAFIGKGVGKSDPVSAFLICTFFMITLAAIFLILAIKRQKIVNHPVVKN